jgi:hypothetical protein
VKKIEIDILNVFKTGVFHNLKGGETREWIMYNFVEPDYVVDGETWKDSNFWRYGNIDFFLEDDKLKEICVRSLNPLIGGKSFKINKWIIKEPEKLTVKFVIEKLLSERIDFTIMHTVKQYQCQASIGLIKSSVFLIFQPKQPEESECHFDWVDHKMRLINPNDYILGGFSIFENLNYFNELVKNKNGL